LNTARIHCQERTDGFSGIEEHLRNKEFVRSWVVIFAEESWTSVPLLHAKLLSFLWDAHANLKTEHYPPTLLIWGHTTTAPVLKKKYEVNMSVRFCCSREQVIREFLGLGDSSQAHSTQGPSSTLL